MSVVKASPPPPGIYVPAVVFFDENDELDIPSIQSHVLRLAKVGLPTSYAVICLSQNGTH